MRLGKKFIVTIFVLLGISMIVHAQETKEVILSPENKVWESFLGSQFNASSFRSWLAEDYLAIDPTGVIYSAEQTIALLTRCTFATYEIVDPEVRSLTRDSHPIVYRVPCLECVDSA